MASSLSRMSFETFTGNAVVSIIELLPAYALTRQEVSAHILSEAVRRQPFALHGEDLNIFRNLDTVFKRDLLDVRGGTHDTVGILGPWICLRLLCQSVHRDGLVSPGA